MHVGALRAWEGRPPVGIKLVIEGQEEVGSALSTYPQSRPELFAADAMVIADMGSVRPGVPTLTVALRGMAMATVEVRDARRAEAQRPVRRRGSRRADRRCCTRSPPSTTSNGDVAVAGLRREEWTGRVVQRRRVPRAGRGRCPALPLLGHRRARLADLVGAGDHGHRASTSRRSTTRCQRGLAVRAREDQPARASRSRTRSRRRPRCQPPREPAAVRDRARGARGRDRQRLRGGDLRAGLRGRARGARERLGQRDGRRRGGGGSIPLVSALQAAVPDAEMLLLGTTDGYANIHAPNERVLLDEFEKAVVAEAEFFGGTPRPGAGGRERRRSAAARRRRTRSSSACSTGSSAPATRCPTRRSCSSVLCGGVIVLSQILFWFDVKATYEVVDAAAGRRPSRPTTAARSSPPTSARPSRSRPTPTRS